MFSPAATAASRKRAACAVSVPSATSSSRLCACSTNLRMLTAMCRRVMSGMTTCSREPSGSIASTNGVDRSIRRPRRAQHPLDQVGAPRRRRGSSSSARCGRARATNTRPGSLTQNYFPVFDDGRSLTGSATELGICRLSPLGGECRDWPSCGLVADWPRTKIAGPPALSPSRDTTSASDPDQHAACGAAPEGRSASLRDGPPAHPSPAVPQSDRGGLRGAGPGGGGTDTRLIRLAQDCSHKVDSNP